MSWLADRFDPGSGEARFVQYHAAVALLEAVLSLAGTHADELAEALGAARANLRRPDSDTARVLAQAQGELGRRAA